MIPVEGLERITFKDDNTTEAVDATYNHESGFVTLVDFWVKNILLILGYMVWPLPGTNES